MGLALVGPNGWHRNPGQIHDGVVLSVVISVLALHSAGAAVSQKTWFLAFGMPGHSLLFSHHHLESPA